jgi:hypothetical protein
VPRIVLLALASTMLAAGCASRQRGGAPTGQPNVITQEEIAAARVTNAFDAVTRLRPNFFRDRGRASILGRDQRAPILYVDEQRVGDLARMRELDATLVWEIRYFGATESQQKWGNGHAGGVIQVLTLRSRPGV